MCNAKACCPSKEITGSREKSGEMLTGRGENAGNYFHEDQTKKNVKVVPVTDKDLVLNHSSPPLVHLNAPKWHLATYMQFFGHFYKG